MGYTRIDAQSIILPTSIRGALPTDYTVNNRPADIGIVGGSSAVTTNDGDGSYLDWHPTTSPVGSEAQCAEVYLGNTDLRTAKRITAHMTGEKPGGVNWVLDAMYFNIVDAAGQWLLGNGTGVLAKYYLEIISYPDVSYVEGYTTVFDSVRDNGTIRQAMNPAFDPTTGIYLYMWCQRGYNRMPVGRWTEVWLEVLSADEEVHTRMAATPFVATSHPGGDVVTADSTGALARRPAYVVDTQGAPFALWNTGEITAWSKQDNTWPLHMVNADLTNDVWFKYPPITAWSSGNVDQNSLLPNYEANTILVQISDYPAYNLNLYQIDYTGTLVSTHPMGADTYDQYLDTGDVYKGKLYYLADTGGNLYPWNSEHSLPNGSMRCFNLTTNQFEPYSIDLWTRINNTDNNPTTLTTAVVMAIDPINGDLWFCAECPYFQTADASQWTPGFCLMKYTIDGTFVARYDFLQSSGYLYSPGIGGMTIVDGNLYVYMAGTFFYGPSGQTRWEKDGIMKFSPGSMTPNTTNPVPDMWRTVSEYGSDIGWVVRPMIGVQSPNLAGLLRSNRNVFGKGRL